MRTVQTICATDFFSVVFQEFNANVDTENYVIKGNDAILKCDIPSFVTDLVDISGWIDSSGNEYYHNSGKKYWPFYQVPLIVLITVYLYGNLISNKDSPPQLFSRSTVSMYYPKIMSSKAMMQY